MKRWMLFGLLLVGMTAQAQTARKFTLDLTDDGKAQMVCFLPETPSGKAIVGVPGGGYSMLSNTHEGYLASDWLNQQGIAYFVVNYRLPNGDRTQPSGASILTMWVSWASRQVVIWHPSSPPIPSLTSVPTSRFCSIPSSRWMNEYPTSGRA